MKENREDYKNRTSGEESSPDGSMSEVSSPSIGLVDKENSSGSMSLGLGEKSSEEAEAWLEVFPYGINFNLDGFASPQRPIIFFKNEEKTQVLPVWLSSLDASLAISHQNPRDVTSSSHQISWRLLKLLGGRLERCLFAEMRGNHLYVELHFSGLRKGLTKILSRADEAISFCLGLNTRFYCQESLIECCRQLEVESLSSNNPMEGRLEDIEGPHYIN